MRKARRHDLIRPAIVAAVLAWSGAAAFAESFDAVVHTRDLSAGVDGLGRAGGSAYVDNRDAALETQQSQAGAAAWDKTKAGAESAWDHTKAFVTQKPAIPPDEPQRYGRAGGFIGAEQFEVPQPGVTELGSAPANDTAVKTGESQWGYSDRASAGTATEHGTNQSGAAPVQDKTTPPQQN
jgi:hypothetical protein